MSHHARVITQSGLLSGDDSTLRPDIQGEPGDNWGVYRDNDPWEDYKLVPLFVALMYIGNVNCNIRGLNTILYFVRF